MSHIPVIPVILSIVFGVIAAIIYVYFKERHLPPE